MGRGGGGYVSKRECGNYSLKTVGRTRNQSISLREFLQENDGMQEFPQIPANSRKIPASDQAIFLVIPMLYKEVFLFSFFM
jgi:hypothetical protein